MGMKFDKKSLGLVRNMLASGQATQGARIRLPDLEPIREAPPGRWLIRIQGWRPVNLNRLLSSNHFTRGKLKKKDYARIAEEAFLYQVPRATRPRRVGILLSFGKKESMGDPDNYSKSLRDALVHAGLIVDDAVEWATFTEPKLVRDGKFTEIYLEDIDVPPPAAATGLAPG